MKIRRDTTIAIFSAKGNNAKLETKREKKAQSVDLVKSESNNESEKLSKGAETLEEGLASASRRGRPSVRRLSGIVSRRLSSISESNPYLKNFFEFDYSDSEDDDGDGGLYIDESKTLSRAKRRDPRLHKGFLVGSLLFIAIIGAIVVGVLMYIHGDRDGSDSAANDKYPSVSDGKNSTSNSSVSDWKNSTSNSSVILNPGINEYNNSQSSGPTGIIDVDDIFQDDGLGIVLDDYGYDDTDSLDDVNGGVANIGSLNDDDGILFIAPSKVDVTNPGFLDENIVSSSSNISDSKNEDDAVTKGITQEESDTVSIGVCEEGGLHGPWYCETMCSNAACCFAFDVNSDTDCDPFSLNDDDDNLSCDDIEFCKEFLLSGFEGDCGVDGAYGPDVCALLCEGLECCWSTDDEVNCGVNESVAKEGDFAKCQENYFCQNFLLHINDDP